MNKNEISEACVRQKVAKNRNWDVCKSGVDLVNKRFWYDVKVNATSSETRFIDWVDVCKDYGWEKFDINESSQTIRFTPIKAEEQLTEEKIEFCSLFKHIMLNKDIRVARSNKTN